MIADLASAVRNRERTAVESVTAALDAAEASQTDLNAFTTIDREGAIARASLLDERIGGGDDPGSLAGVPNRASP